MRTAAAKELDPEAIRLAVTAHIRPAHTGHDEIPMGTAGRAPARGEVEEDVGRVLDGWRRAKRREAVSGRAARGRPRPGRP